MEFMCIYIYIYIYNYRTRNNTTLIYFEGTPSRFLETWILSPQKTDCGSCSKVHMCMSGDGAISCFKGPRPEGGQKPPRQPPSSMIFFIQPMNIKAISPLNPTIIGCHWSWKPTLLRTGSLANYYIHN